MAPIPNYLYPPTQTDSTGQPKEFLLRVSFLFIL